MILGEALSTVNAQAPLGGLSDADGERAARTAGVSLAEDRPRASKRFRHGLQSTDRKLGVAFATVVVVAHRGGSGS
jgi:hypothetical protein